MGLFDKIKELANSANDKYKQKIEDTSASIIEKSNQAEGGEANCPTRRSFLPHSVLKLTPLGERIDQEFQKWHR